MIVDISGNTNSGTAGIDWDLLNVVPGGQLTLPSGTLNIGVYESSAATVSSGDIIEIMQFAFLVDGNPTITVTDNNAAGDWNILNQTVSGPITLQFTGTVVPEPGVFTLLGGALLGPFLRKRRAKN